MLPNLHQNIDIERWLIPILVSTIFIEIGYLLLVIKLIITVIIPEYKKYIDSLVNFMGDHGYTTKPFPKIKLNNRKQDGVFIYTGYYDPENKVVTIFINNRHIKDWMRSLAHELLHHKQNIEGRLGKDAYSGDKITEDKKLINLEAEAYLYGNIAFRKWTEYMKGKM